MAKNETRLITYIDLINSSKLYMQRARRILPYLVRQAKAGKPIYYSDLAAETGIPNARNLNYPLGAIGNGLLSLGTELGIEIPPIQCLVINKNTKLPGEGIGWFISENDFKKLSRTKKSELIQLQLAKIYSFTQWNKVLLSLGLEEINDNLEPLIEKARSFGFGGGESENHRKFKEAIAENPLLIGLKTEKVRVEYRLPSADCIDILFTNKSELIGIEVKSALSADEDILRGLFQCIKYKCLIESEQIVQHKEANARIILVLQGKFPPKLLSIKNMLGIEVIDQVNA